MSVPNACLAATKNQPTRNRSITSFVLSSSCIHEPPTPSNAVDFTDADAEVEATQPHKKNHCAGLQAGLGSVKGLKPTMQLGTAVFAEAELPGTSADPGGKWLKLNANWRYFTFQELL